MSGKFRGFGLWAELAFFVYGFAKSDLDNITEDEETQFKKAAAYVLELTKEQLAKLIEEGQFIEVLERD